MGKLQLMLRKAAKALYQETDFVIDVSQEIFVRKYLTFELFSILMITTNR